MLRVFGLAPERIQGLPFMRAGSRGGDPAGKKRGVERILVMEPRHTYVKNE